MPELVVDAHELSFLLCLIASYKIFNNLSKIVARRGLPGDVAYTNFFFSVSRSWNDCVVVVR